MATSQIPPFQLVSEDWQIAEAEAPKPPSLVVQERRRIWALPWFRFVWAEGTTSEIKIAFATHVVTVTGHGLAALLGALAEQRVIRLIQPSENETKFGVRGSNASGYSGPSIADISVRSIDEDSE